MNNVPQQTSAAQGAALTVGMRWADRIIGVASTLILARLLLPDDFGLIAMATLFIQLLDMMMDLGVNVALVQNRNATKGHYDSAWTLRLVQTGIGAALTVAAAPLAANYFNEPRLETVLPFMALGFILSGLENIWIVEFQKKMQFKRDVAFMLSRRLAGFVTTITLAWYLHSYWALVIGALVGRAVGVALSYFMHPAKPSFSLRQWQSIFRVSQWMIVNSIGQYLDGSVASLLVGRRNDTSVMGGFALAREISGIPTTELLIPINRVLFPLFAGTAHDHSELKRVYLLAQGVQCAIGIPAAIGLALVANEAVTVMLGERWLFTAPLIEVMALSSVIIAITTSGNYVMITLGEVRNAALIAWIRVAVFAVLVWLLMSDFSALNVARLRLATVVIGFGIAVWMLMRTLRNVRLLDIAQSIFRPLVASIAMGFAVIAAESTCNLSAPLLLPLKILVGALTYSSALYALWRLFGRPEGAERYLLSIIASLSRRRRPRARI